MPELDVITAGIPRSRNDCPILRRVKAFIVSEGVRATIEHIFRDRQGRPMDLSTVDTVSESASISSTEPDTVLARIREIMGNDQSTTWLAEGQITDAANGVVQVLLPHGPANQSGLYNLSLAFIRGGEIQLVNDTLLSVEASLFGKGNGVDQHTQGPPTIDEIRMHMWDSDPAENVLLDDLEFGAEQICSAISKPVEYFNETNPPIGLHFTTANYPYRSHWLDAIVSHLLTYAAAFYRRNRLQGGGGGLQVDDLNKAEAYEAVAKAGWNDYKDFVLRKKTEINMAQCVGSLGSEYGASAQNM
jgi:hypothetical protein